MIVSNLLSNFKFISSLYIIIVHLYTGIFI